MKKVIMVIAGVCMSTQVIAQVKDYELQYINPEGFENNGSGERTISLLTQAMDFETDYNALEEIKVERQFSRCLIDNMWHDKQKYGLTNQDFTGLIGDVVHYYRRFGTSVGFTLPNETTEYIGELEIKCVDYHPQPAGVHSSLAERRVMEQCNWDQVSNKEEFDAAANCRKRVTQEYYKDNGIEPY